MPLPRQPLRCSATSFWNPRLRLQLQTQTAAVTPGQTVTFTLTRPDGYTLTGADYPGTRLTRTGTGYTLSLPEVRYSTAVAVTAEKSDTVLCYRDNLGGDWIEAPVTASHLRVNTAIQGELFNNPGHTLTGWNTAPDGSGQAVGLGSRTAPGSRLYAQWAAQNDAAEFTFTVNNGTATVTGWQGSGERLSFPIRWAARRWLRSPLALLQTPPAGRSSCLTRCAASSRGPLPAALWNR